MNYIKSAAFAALIASSAFTSATWAESSKFSAATSDHVLLQGMQTDYTTVLSTDIRSPSQKDLFVQVSMECGLYTQTLVSSLFGELDQSQAEAVVRARVILDPGTASEQLAFPGEITLCARNQEMSASFAGICEDDNNDGIVNYDECDESEELGLAMTPLKASAFNFVLANLRSGEHTVAVQAKIDSSTSFDSGTATASAIVGNGTLAAEEVRMVKSAEVQEDPAGSGSDTWLDFMDLF
ncbi:hypothetical protein I6N98_02970 [Spongiibacter nanhainus]|uniref:Uncharacterized protein n=1 Tax=Spongiibacter nanhainus TaxID=2794344 RepID=A0A7T4UQK2_9GAMM|nr:hypothetical protein [Spongiibacter nanhainus]QQD18843.1 hypothetical protein I6N98_02970 [Spongiibacter nanhainus]